MRAAERGPAQSRVYESLLSISARGVAPEAEGADGAGEAEALGGAGTLFLVELQYAGHFALPPLERDDQRGFLLVQAPGLLFPFARRVIADATRDGGFPPLLLDMPDFAGLMASKNGA